MECPSVVVPPVEEDTVDAPADGLVCKKRSVYRPDLGRYKRHPDANQDRFFFGLLRECLDQGIVSEEMLREEMARNHVRHDALEVIERTPPLAA